MNRLEAFLKRPKTDAWATCVLGHRKHFTGFFVDRRVERWFVQHEHPENDSY